ncbi:peptidoglycan-binding domain-containing protein [Roseibium sp.]|uniref:peptidoglycan-binding domain-containing protein n=1 Tax=Roseibium sp. TaxID=1936156 RepID=UPI003A975FC9
MSFCVSVVSVFLCLSPGSANADRYVTCIQEQLEDAGLDPGPIDGKLGRKTRSALGELGDQYPQLSNLPKLSIPNASVFCRKIGMLRDNHVGWTSNDDILKLIIGKKTSSSSAEKIRSLTNNVNYYYLEKLNITIPGQIVFITSSSVDEAGKRAVEALKAQGSHHDVYKEFTDWCRGYGYCGKSYGGVVAVSFSDKDGFPNDDVRKLLAHETAHEIQAQYVGNYRAHGEENRVRARGPKWLTEALAIALEYNFLRPDVSAEKKREHFAQQRNYSAKRLRSFKYQTSAAEKDFYDYARYAGLFLVSKSSERAIIDFWEKTPELGWEGAFSQSFNMSLEEFYRLFDE